MKKCFIGLGSNERTAARLLAAQSDLCMSFPGIVFSRLVQTAPVGFDSPRMFYNQVACFTTPLCYDGEVLKPQDWLRVDVREGVAELASS